MTAITINRYVPTQLETKLYTISRAAKILGIKKDNIEFIYPMNDGCLIGLWNDAIFIKKVEFVKLMGLERKARSNGLTVTPNAFDSTVFTVRNDNQGTAYRVETHQDYMTCTCKDYEHLSHDFGTSKVSCKHIYAVLGHLGHNDLRSYLKAVNTDINEPEYSTLHMAEGHY